MADIKKSRVVIASVLKPVNDARMAEKIGESLAGNQFDVHIIGFPAAPLSGKMLTPHPLPYFSRLSARRILMPWKIARKALALRPDVFIITTHELLGAALFVKLITRCSVIYDVQENYFRNILYTRSFPLWIRPLLAWYVRLKEILTARFIDHFFLAERSYASELSFQGAHHTILENKFKKPLRAGSQKRKLLHLIFSGTLGESTGVFIAIDLATRLHSANSAVTLTIIGYCSRPAELKKIKEAIRPLAFIRLIGGNKLVPHRQILEHLQSASAGIISYPSNPSTSGSIPTKLFEYLGLQLPILLINHPNWIDYCAPYNAAIVFDPAEIDARDILQTLRSKTFYTVAPRDVFWEAEEPGLIRQVNQLIN
jgi:hypothetical protein